MIIRWDLFVLLAVLLGLAVTDPANPWAYGCTFCAGMVFERIVQVARVSARAARRLRESEIARAAREAECSCHAPSGPHEPDCVWWDWHKKSRSDANDTDRA